MSTDPDPNRPNQSDNLDDDTRFDSESAEPPAYDDQMEVDGACPALEESNPNTTTINAGVIFKDGVPLLQRNDLCHDMSAQDSSCNSDEADTKLQQQLNSNIREECLNDSCDQAGLNFGPLGGGPGSPFGGPSQPRPDPVPDTFRLCNIGGLEEEKGYLNRAILLPLIRSDVLKLWGVNAPKGVLLYGPPGTGKTYMAKAIYNELKAKMPGKRINFFYRKGGDVFSMWFGESQRKLREVFDVAKALKPSVLFFDELDGLCPSRENSMKSGSDVYSSVVTCFLGQMDSLANNSDVFVIGATNRLEAVDPAVRRPGRFDKQLSFGFPDEEARREIIQIHTRAWNHQDKPNEDLLRMLAQRTLGFSGADIEKLCKDVVFVAINSSKTEDMSKMKVTEENWLQAIGEMKRTASTNFGSALYIPTKPNELISRLIQPVVQNATQRIQSLVQRASAASASSLADSSSSVLSFLLYQTPAQSKNFLNSQIVNGILSEPIFNKTAIFQISPFTITNKVLTGAKASLLHAVDDVVNQALEASINKLACVVVINLNEVVEAFKQAKIPKRTLHNSLRRVQGPKLFLMATSSVPPDNIQDNLTLELFSDRNSHVGANNPTSEHLKDFFIGLFEDKKKNLPRNSLGRQLEDALNRITERAAEIAGDQGYENVIHLVSAFADLDLAKGIEQNDDLIGQLDKIIMDYQKQRPHR